MHRAARQALPASGVPPHPVVTTPSFLSGNLTIEQLIGATSQFGVPLTRQDADDVMSYYAPAGTAFS